ncbi:hypothetical protein [Mycoplasma sp. ATU-Cv-508]
MNFKVGFRIGRINIIDETALRQPNKWPKYEQNKEWHDANDLKLIDTVIKLKIK